MINQINHGEFFKDSGVSMMDLTETTSKRVGHVFPYLLGYHILLDIHFSPFIAYFWKERKRVDVGTPPVLLKHCFNSNKHRHSEYSLT